jgi:retron-type reverse transcriptase
MVKFLEKRIDDKRFIRLLEQMLKTGYIEDWKFFGTYTGTPQGGVISPILSNVYLNELDKYIERLRHTFNKGEERKASFIAQITVC